MASAKQSAQWEKLWANYINALKALDKPIKGANARAARMRLGKAEKAIERFDREAYEKFVVGRNPGREHLPGLPAKAQREYEDILKSSKAAGRYKGREKEVAARTVRKQYGKNPVMMTAALLSIANSLRIKNPYTDLVIKGSAKRVADGWQIGKRVFPWGRGQLQIKPHVYLDKSTGFYYVKKERNMTKKKAAKKRKNIAGFIDDTGFHPIRSGMEMTSSGKTRKSKKKYKPSAVGEKRTYAKKRKAAPKKKAAKKKAVKAVKKSRKAAARRRNVGPLLRYEVYVTIGRGEDVIGVVSARSPKEAIATARRDFRLSIAQEARKLKARKVGARKQGKPARKNPTFDMYVKDRFGPGQVHYGKVTAATAQAAKKILFAQLKSDYIYSKGEPRHKLKDITAKAANPRKIADPTLVERYKIGKAIISIRSTPDGKYTASWTIQGVPGYETGISPTGLNQYKRRKFESVAEAKQAVAQYNRNPSKKIKRRKIGSVWVETRGTSVGNKYVVLLSTSTNRDLGEQMDESRDKKQAEWLARMLRKQIKDGRVKVNPGRKKGKRNPTASQMRKTFAGRHTKNTTLYFPDGTPQGIAKLGKLIKIKLKRGHPIALKNPAGEVWLCCDARGRLHLGSTINAPLFNGPARDFGEVKEIEYMEAKPHLGYPKKTIWFHHMGEEGGARPTLHVNHKGELKFRGGDYRITSRGIED